MHTIYALRVFRLERIERDSGQMYTSDDIYIYKAYMQAFTDMKTALCGAFYRGNQYFWVCSQPCRALQSSACLRAMLGEAVGRGWELTSKRRHTE
jgi:hypothetical protein